MMTAKQIFLLFGFFLSMFYIFKYGNVTSSQQAELCKELETLQLETLSELTPLIRANNSNEAFDAKLKKAQTRLKESPDFMRREKRMWQIKNRLSGQICPAPNLYKMARLAIEN